MQPFTVEELEALVERTVVLETVAQEQVEHIATQLKVLDAAHSEKLAQYQTLYETRRALERSLSLAQKFRAAPTTYIT